MCEDTWRRLDADFDRIIGSLEVVARPGVTSGATPIFSGSTESPSRPHGPLPRNKDFRDASDPAGAYLRSDAVCARVSAVPKDFHAARHSAEAELNGVAITGTGPGGGAEPMIADARPALTCGSRADNAVSGTGVVYEFVPRKGPGAGAPGQVKGGVRHGGGNVPVTNMPRSARHAHRVARKL